MGFQGDVDKWAHHCFGSTDATDKVLRSHRFVEEALELAQACGTTKTEVLQLVDYVFDRPVGEKGQEVGGVAVTLALLCSAYDLSMTWEGSKELDRVWENVGKIREKHLAKPKFGPLPQ
jgi:NTP pyrophosphatase (non-canonical NTP hydrolase)